jgi:DNA-binding PadR family transcriptional regulator
VANNRNLGEKDKRSNVDLELFLIALIDRDINTLYSLHATARLSPGATIPVLNRLESLGYVRRDEPASRRRAEYQTTTAGQRRLRSGWQSLLEAPVPTDIDAIFRVASLGILCGAARKRVAAYLQKAASAKTPDPGDKRRGTQPAGPPEEAVLYAWMKAAQVKARRTAEAKVLRQLALALLKMK